MNDAKQQIMGYYKAQYEKYGVSEKSLGWSKKSQLLRFEVACDQFPQDTGSVLDIGCGFGQLADFLQEKRPPCTYEGWDINESFLQHCVGRDNRTFKLRDILDSPPRENAYDVTLTIGSLNTEFGNNEETARAMIAALYKATRNICIFSATSTFVDEPYRQSHMHYYDPATLFRFARETSRKVDLIHSYLPHDFMLVMKK